MMKLKLRNDLELEQKAVDIRNLEITHNFDEEIRKIIFLLINYIADNKRIKFNRKHNRNERGN